MAKRGKLKDIKLKEISLVDLPANKQSFLFYKGKGNQMNDKTLKALQAYLGTEDINFEKKVDAEEIEKALNLISEHYKADFPEDLENAVGVIAKCAIGSYEVKAEQGNGDVEKAGAKFSKDVIAKLKAIIASVEALKSILPDTKESKEKSDGSDEVAELAKQIAELKGALVKLSDPGKKDDGGSSDLTELAKTLKDVSDRLKAIEDSGATRKSITGDDIDGDDIDGGSENKNLWPTITGKKKK